LEGGYNRESIVRLFYGHREGVLVPVLGGWAVLCRKG
jgi:hypothetical protein